MKKTITTIASIIMTVAILSLAALAQEHQGHGKASGQDVIIGKKGGDHIIVFKEMAMPAGYKMGNTPVGKEVARIKCKVEPVTKKVSNTKITLRTNAAGEKEIAEVQVAGEAFKHLL